MSGVAEWARAAGLDPAAVEELLKAAALSAGGALPIPEALRLVAQWAEDAGMHATWLADANLVAQALTIENATERALLRCALQLLQACAVASGKDAAQLIADLALQPVGQHPEGTRG